jgi:hypothetical protein
MRILNWERKTVRLMIKMYCRNNHQVHNLCNDCSDLLKYSEERTQNCPYGEDKPRCSVCTVHCYKPEMREKIRAVMRYAGPRMIYHSPVTAIQYMVLKSMNK